VVMAASRPRAATLGARQTPDTPPVLASKN